MTHEHTLSKDCPCNPEVESFTYSTGDIIQWLEAKWRRHGEIEDKAAAGLLRAYRERLADIHSLLQCGTFELAKDAAAEPVEVPR